MTCSTCPLDQGPYTVVGSLLLCSRCSSALEAALSNSVSVACHAAGDVTAAFSPSPCPEVAAVTDISRKHLASRTFAANTIASAVAEPSNISNP